MSHAQIELSTRRIEAAISTAWKAARAQLNARTMADVLSGGGVEAVQPILERAVAMSVQQLRRNLPPILRSVMRQAAEQELQRIRREGPASLQDEQPDLAEIDDSGEVPVVSDLDLRELGFDEFGVTITDELVAEATADLSSSTAEALLLLLTLGVAGGVSVTFLAQRLRSGFGLNERQARAVANLANELANARPGTLVTRFRPRPGVRTRPGFSVRVPANVTPAWIEAQLSRYFAMQLNHRARLIARTIVARAWNRGRDLLWTLLLRSGILPPGTVRRWQAVLDDRTCPICRSLHGQLAIVGEPFVSGDIGAIQSPPAHPACRCSAVIVRSRTLSSNQTTKLSIDKKENLMSKAKQVFRRMTTVAGEGADTAAWRATNERDTSKACKCSGKSHANKPTPEHAERDRVLARLRNMTPAERAALDESIRQEWLRGAAPPDSYAAALEARRKEYADDRPKTYTEVA